MSAGLGNYLKPGANKESTTHDIQSWNSQSTEMQVSALLIMIYTKQTQKILENKDTTSNLWKLLKQIFFWTTDRYQSKWRTHNRPC